MTKVSVCIFYSLVSISSNWRAS